MTKISDVTAMIPRMLSYSELVEAMSSYPAYDPSICKEDSSSRLIALSDLYQVYVPSAMSVEIYSKLYLALLRSLQKKGTKLAVRQRNENRKAILQLDHTGIMGGADSFTIIGASGIGKSTAISRAVDLITEGKILEVDEPHTKIIPCIIVQCPFDSSVKGLLLEILRTVDEALDSRYYECAIRARATTDMLIGSVSQVALNHIGMLIVDEIQNVANSKNGKSLVGALTQLINNAGISICLVGAPESTIFFEQAQQLARRSLGLQYGYLEYDAYFITLARTLLTYIYVQKPVILTDGMLYWLYEHSRGIPAVLVLLIHDAQEIAILSGREILDIRTLKEAFEKRLTIMRDYLHTEAKKPGGGRKMIKQIHMETRIQEPVETMCIATCVQKAKETGRDIVEVLREVMAVEEVNA